MGNREEKSLHHIVMVAKFLDDNKRKTSLKKSIRIVWNFIDLIQCHLICQIFWGCNQKDRIKVQKYYKEKEIFVLHLPTP